MKQQFAKRREVYSRLKLHDLSLAVDNMQQGELSKATERLWGATASAVKELGIVKGLLLRRHRELREFVEQLGFELKDPYFGRAFAAGEQMHANFYDDFLSHMDVVAHYERTRIFIGK